MTHDPSKTTPAPASLFDEDESDLSMTEGSPVHVGVISDETKATAKAAAHEIGKATKAEVERAWKRSQHVAAEVAEHIQRKRPGPAFPWKRTGLYVGIFAVVIACIGFYVRHGTPPLTVSNPPGETAPEVANAEAREERAAPKTALPTPRSDLTAVPSAIAVTRDSKPEIAPTAERRLASTLAEVHAAPAMAMPALAPGHVDASSAVEPVSSPTSSASSPPISAESTERPAKRLEPSAATRPPSTRPDKHAARRPSIAAPVSNPSVAVAAGPIPSQLKAEGRERPVAEQVCTTAGTVLGAKGAPLAGARVQLEELSGGEVRRVETGEAGGFGFDVRSPSPRVRLTVRAKGHLDYVADIRACQTLAPIVLTKSNPLSALRNVARRADRALDGLRSGDGRP